MTLRPLAAAALAGVFLAAADPLPEPELRPVAARSVLDDAALNLRYLKAEARFLARDARSHWGSIPAGLGGPSASPRIQRLQMETFSLYDAALRLEESLPSCDAALMAAGRVWATVGPEDPDRVRDAAAEAVRRVNALDAEIARLQAELDRIHPRLLAAFAKHAPQSAPPVRPWHWVYYMDANRRRPVLRLDFDALYGERGGRSLPDR